MNKREIKKIENVLSKVWRKYPELYILILFIPLMAGAIVSIS